MQDKALEYALYLFGMGAKVFPLKARSKFPPKGVAWKEWAEHATKESIEEYGKKHKNCNWAIACGPSGLTVLDIDIKEKNGEIINGFDTLKGLPVLPRSFSVKTPHGGNHVYYFGASKNTVEEIGPGLDTRSTGGYVVAPGSVNENGVPYEIINTSQIAPVPQWIIERLGKNNHELMAPQTQQDLLGQFEEGKRNDQFTKLAGHLRGLGFGKDLILSSMMEVNSRISVPLEQKELEIIAWSIAKKPPGQALANAKAVATFESHTYQPLQFYNFDTIKMENIPPLKWILKGEFIGGLVSLLVSRGGLGKSLLSILQAVAVSTGLPLTGDKVVNPGRVWIHNAEDGRHDLERRLSAISAHYKLEQNIFKNICYTTGLSYKIVLAASYKGSVVKNEEEISRIIKVIKDAGIVLWLIDPFIRLHRCDENSNEEMDVVMEILTDIAQATGCAIGLVHHTNKSGNDSNGNPNASRGASAVINASRISSTIRQMNTEEANKLREEGQFNAVGEGEEKWYIRKDNAKSNFNRPMSQARWYKKISVQIANGEEVGCLQHIELHDKKKDVLEKSKQALEDAALDAIIIMMKGQKQTSLSKLTKDIHNSTKVDHLISEVKPQSSYKLINGLLEVPRSHKGFKLILEEHCLNGRTAKYIYKEKEDMSFLK